MTLAEYLATPETALPRELAFGAYKVADAPLLPHQFAVGRLFLALSAYLDTHRDGSVWLSPIDVILDVRRALVVQPDLVVIKSDRAHIMMERIYGAPDLAIEVLSPDPRVGLIDQRLGWFAAYGARECWLVHLLDRRVEVVQFAGGRQSSRHVYDAREPIRSSVLEGFDRTLESMLGW